ncbi:hypothetical protein [Pseudovibrio sp. Ad37]|uniref:hypothetical protein n=1 Tax=Pseudovibrio sp. Ad37 TaxID=989422 RepID=UPI0007AEC5CE|nr:hypothetical protein [Pseudovibrio sp. Ad37]KZL13603.1 hypothetical protein PsAD37_05360 [Pseudovibrio sp. Ad37]
MSGRRKEHGSRSHGVRERRHVRQDSHFRVYQKWVTQAIWIRISPAATTLITEMFLDCENDNHEPVQISLREAAEKARVSEPTAHAALKELVEYNWLQKEQGGALEGPLAHRAAQYRITPPEHEKGWPHFRLYRKWRNIPAWIYLSNEGRKLHITLKASHKYRSKNKFPIDIYGVKALLNCKDRKAREAIAELVEKGFLHREGVGQRATYSFTDMLRCGEQKATECFRHWRPEEPRKAA